MPTKRFKIQFTEFIPEEIKEDILYISMEYATASHKCACGCGQEVVTPFTPTDWKLIYDGESVSLSPSIGNWSYPCRAHYFIQNNQVRWANAMSHDAIEAGRRRDRVDKAKHYTQTNDIEILRTGSLGNESEPQNSTSNNRGLLATIARFFGFNR